MQSTCVRVAGNAHNRKQDFPASSTEVAGKSRRAAAKHRERETPRSTAAASSSIVIPAENTGVSGLAGAIKHLLARRGGTYFSLARGDQASHRPSDSAWRRSASSETEIPRGSHLRREKLLKKTFFFGKNESLCQRCRTATCVSGLAVNSHKRERALPLLYFCLLENGCDQ